MQTAGVAVAPRKGEQFPFHGRLVSASLGRRGIVFGENHQGDSDNVRKSFAIIGLIGEDGHAEPVGGWGVGEGTVALQS